MRTRRQTWTTALAGPLLVVALIGLSGCGEPVPAPSPVSTSSPTPVPTLEQGGAGNDGLTVRYLGEDGRVRSLAPKDFPR